MQSGKFLGAGNTINIVDTPGFSSAYDNGSFTTLLNFLKTEVKHVNTFAILWSATDNRFSYDQQQMIKQMHEGFGNSFWDNVVYVVTKWSMHTKSIQLRMQAVPQLTKELMTTVLTNRANTLLNIKKKPNVLFLDSFHHRNAYEEKYFFDIDAFQLMKIASNMKPFNCSTNKISLNEVQQLKYTYQALVEDIKVIDKNIVNENIKNENLKNIFQKAGKHFSMAIFNNKSLNVLEILLIFIAALFAAILFFAMILKIFGSICIACKCCKNKELQNINIHEQDFDANYI